MVGKDGDFIVGSDIGNFDFQQTIKRPEDADTNYRRQV